MENFMNKLLFCLLAGYTGFLMGAAEPMQQDEQRDMLTYIVEQAPEQLFPHLQTKDVKSLTLVNKSISEQALTEMYKRQEPYAIWLSYVLNAKDLNLSNRRNHRFINDFIGTVQQQITQFAEQNPGQWIKLNLSWNQLTATELSQLLQAVVATVQRLHIDVATLYLHANQLTVLPEHIFAGLNNLQRLDLGYNQLTVLPEHVFAGLNNLQTLNLDGNQSTAVSELLLQSLRARGVNVLI